MTPLWFLKLALKCIDLLSWPLLALGYPLCASIQAIESDSHSDTRNLISYWILLSLIYLFEYAFHKLLQWFQYWPYIKLMIIAWLVIPDFGRASYFYNRVVYSCISMNPQEVISRFRNLKKLFVKKENFLLQAEKYITENGTEALEKLIASKNTAQNPNAEATKAVPATQKNEMQQVMNMKEMEHRFEKNKVRLDIEQKDIKDLEMIEKEKIPEGKQNTAQNPNAVAMKAVPATEKNEMQQVMDKKETEQQIEKDKGRLDIEQKDIKDLEMSEKKEVPEGKGNTAASNLKLKENTSFTIVEAEGTAGKDKADGECLKSCESKKIQKEWTCAMCQVTTTCEKNLKLHLDGRKHKATCKALEAKSQYVAVKKNDKSNEQAAKMMDIANALKQTITANQQGKVEQKHIQVSKSMLGNEPKGRTIKDEKNESKGVSANSKVQGLQVKSCRLRCEICGVNCTSEGDMASHLKGWRHLAQIQ